MWRHINSHQENASRRNKCSAWEWQDALYKTVQADICRLIYLKRNRTWIKQIWSSGNTRCDNKHSSISMYYSSLFNTFRRVYSLRVSPPTPASYVWDGEETKKHLKERGDIFQWDSENSQLSWAALVWRSSKGKMTLVPPSPLSCWPSPRLSPL